MNTVYPERMTSLPQWVVSGDDKIPLDPKTRRRADTTNPATWSDFATARQVAAQHRLNLGFVFTKASRIVGTDLDKCRNAETGVIEPWALAIVQRLNSLTEISFSGTGLHIFAESDELPEGGRKKGRIEMYDSGRHFLMTGNILPGYETLADRTDELKRMHAEVFTKPEPTKPARPTAPSAPLNRDTETILDDVRKTAKGRQLLSGDMSSYPSQSEADQALCNLYVAAGASRSQADDLFRRSALFREKWDQRRGDRTYGEKTLDKAFDGSVRLWNTFAAMPTYTVQSDTFADDDSDPCSQTKRENLRLRAELDQMRAERDELQKTIDRLRVRIHIADQRLATYQNPGLGSAKAVASGLIQIFAAETPAKPESDAGYRVPLGKLADITGLSEDACSRQIKQLAKYTLPDSDTPIIHYNVASVGGLDRETGELIAPHKEMWLGPGVDVKEFANVVSTLKPAEKPKWGGITNEGTCADHPHDGVIQRVRYQKTVSYECSVCNHVLREETSPVASKRSTAKHLTRIPTPHDAAQQEETDLDFVPMPQDANSINTLPTAPVADNYVGKMRHRAEPQTRPLFPKPTAEEHAAGLAVWSQGMKPTPLDQYTDVANGAKP